MSYAAIDVYLQYWCMYIVQYAVKIAGNVYGKFAFPLQILVHFFSYLASQWCECCSKRWASLAAAQGAKI
jgi:hypothetical protein